MKHSVTITAGLMDWQIVQQENGVGQVVLEGVFDPHQDLVGVGVKEAYPRARVIQENDGSILIPWTKAQEIHTEDGCRGTYRLTLQIPAGGLYVVETALRATLQDGSVMEAARGDAIFHVGVGDVFILAGQSNASGHSSDYCEDAPQLGIHMLRNRNAWDLACHPLHESRGTDSAMGDECGVTGATPFLSFAKTYQKVTGMPVGLIQTAFGGSPIAWWLPEGEKRYDLWENLVERLDYVGGKVAGVLWYQGCSDADTVEKAEGYFEKFKIFVAAVRAHAGAQIPFFTCQLNRLVGSKSDREWGIVRQAQRDAAKQIPGVYVMSTMNLNLSDCVHTSASGNVVLGQRLGYQCAHVLHGAPAYEAPDFRNATVMQQGEEIWLQVAFDHVKAGLPAPGISGEKPAFLLEDAEGEVPMLSSRRDPESPDSIFLQLARKPGSDAVLSYAWQADPYPLPIVENMTLLPPLSFYRQPIQKG